MAARLNIEGKRGVNLRARPSTTACQFSQGSCNIKHSNRIRCCFQLRALRRNSLAQILEDRQFPRQSAICC
jgi:hypothetical protein